MTEDEIRAEAERGAKQTGELVEQYLARMVWQEWRRGEQYKEALRKESAALAQCMENQKQRV
jgi:hypothetical protein